MKQEIFTILILLIILFLTCCSMSVTEPESSSESELMSVNKCHNSNDINIRQKEMSPGNFTKEYYKCNLTTEGNYVFQRMTPNERDSFINGEYRIVKADIKREEEMAKKTATQCTHSICDNTILLDCVDGHYIARDCRNNRSIDNEPNICVQFNRAEIDIAMCTSPKTACKRENQITRKKVSEYSDQSICTRALDGNLYYIPYGVRPTDAQINLPF